MVLHSRYEQAENRNASARATWATRPYECAKNRVAAPSPSPMRLLLIEDSLRLQESLSAGFKHAGFAVDAVGDGTRGLVFAKREHYDVVILDLMLPGMSGLEILTQLRAADSDVHILILTAKHTVEDRVTGLQLGADDYVTKPFAFDELLARVQTLVRRSYGSKSPTESLGQLSIDTAGRQVTLAGAKLKLTQREYQILEYLIRRRGAVASRLEIEDHIYGEANLPESNSVESAISVLRRKLNEAAGRKVDIIRTRRGLGYFIEAGEV